MLVLVAVMHHIFFLGIENEQNDFS
jgi:hypothetical protein